jgi:hypothetical protein
VWWHCVQCHVGWYLAWGHRVCRPHWVARSWPASQRCCVWSTADTTNRKKQSASAFHEMWPLPQHMSQAFENKMLRRIHELTRSE